MKTSTGGPIQNPTASPTWSFTSAATSSSAYSHNIAGEPDTRNRPGEFETSAHRTRDQLLAAMEEAFGIVDGLLERLPLACLFDMTQIRGENRTVLDIIASSSNHTAEHLGQIIYIAKIRLGPRYQYLLKV